MVNCFIQFNLPKYMIPLNIILALNTVHSILSDFTKFGTKKKNPITLPLLMFIGESLVYFFYLFQNKYYLNHIKRITNIDNETFLNNKNRIFSKKSIGLILFCSFTELISNIRYINYFFNDNTNKSLLNLKYPIEFISFFPFFLINERYILKSEIFRHQILGLGIGSLCTLIALIKIKELSISIFLATIIIIECKFLETFHYIIPKKLNTEYFININLICALKGLFGFIISLILFIIFYFL